MRTQDVERRLGRVVPAHLLDARLGRRQLLPQRGNLGDAGIVATMPSRIQSDLKAVLNLEDQVLKYPFLKAIGLKAA